MGHVSGALDADAPRRPAAAVRADACAAGAAAREGRARRVARCPESVGALAASSSPDAGLRESVPMRACGRQSRCGPAGVSPDAGLRESVPVRACGSLWGWAEEGEPRCRAGRAGRAGGARRVSAGVITVEQCCMDCHGL